MSQKLVMEKAIIVQADKRKTIVIRNAEEYSKKVHTFVTDNNFHLIQKGPTTKYQQLIHRTLQECNLIIDKKKIKYLIQQKPSPPTLKAHLKLHKTAIPMRPVINNVEAPTYKIAEHLVKLLNKHITLNNQYNIRNSTSLAADLVKLNLSKDHLLITHDIRELYVHIPIEEMVLKNGTQ